jgi:hypothetical protein
MSLRDSTTTERQSISELKDNPPVSDTELQAHRRILPRLGLSQVKLANSASPKLFLTLLDCTPLQHKLQHLSQHLFIIQRAFQHLHSITQHFSVHLHRFKYTGPATS